MRGPVGRDRLRRWLVVVTISCVQPAERFAANMKRFRERRGLSQEAFALEAKIHRTEVTKLESGRRDPKLATMVKVALALEVSLADLLDGIGELPGSVSP